MKSHQVRFWDIRPRKTASGWSYTVRWTVGAREKSRTLARKAQAERFRSQLMQAADRGEAFDVAAGLPDSMTRESSTITWYQHACAFVDARWPKVAAKGRISLVEGLMAVTPELVTTTRGAPEPEVLREAMRKWAFNPTRRSTTMPAEIAAALAWLAKASVPVTALQEASLVSKALDACGRKLDGSAAAPEYYRRRRRIFYSALKYAARENRLASNPLAATDDKEWQAPEVNSAVDRRRVANPAQMEALLQAIRETGKTQGPRLVALYGCMYYGGLRPSEAASLLRDECKLPAEGWGLIEFSQIRSAAGREWTDDGDTHETRGPKGGPRNAVRRVPIPPVLVQMLGEHIDQFGTADDGRLFRTCRGGIFLPSTLWQVLQKARKKTLTPAQIASPLARKPYDFRHAGISWRLNAGTPATLVAEWAGHTVEVVYRIYAHCIEGDDERWFARMEEALVTTNRDPSLDRPLASVSGSEK